MFSRIGIFTLLGILLLTGCNQAHPSELGNLNVVIGFFLDYFPKEERYRLQCEIADFSGYEKSSDIPVKMITAEGNTIEQVFEKTNKISAKELYLSHAKIILLGSGFQSISLKETIDYFLNHPDISSNIQICMSQRDLTRESEDSSDSFCVPLAALIERNHTAHNSTLYQLYQKDNQIIRLPVVHRTNDALMVDSSALFSNYYYQMTVFNHSSN